MKKHLTIKLLLLFICVSFYTSQAQNAGHEQLTLSVEQMVDNMPRELHFKPNKKLKILTKKGEVIVTKDYSFLSDAIVSNGERIRVAEKNARHLKYNKTALSDTISLSEIEWIKGRVFGNSDRKVLGGLVVAAGTFGIFISAVGIVFSASAAPALLIIPFSAVIIGGTKMMMGTRKFKTSKGWQVKLE